ncbi:hypothetical protein GQ54DRAFT_238207, partial [Martensiomyces pterosporus]
QDERFRGLIHFLKNKSHPEGTSREERKRVWSMAQNYFLSDGLLFRRQRTSMPARVVLEPEEQRRIIAAIHE